MSELYFSPKVVNEDDNTLSMKRIHKSEKLSELEESNKVEESNEVEESNDVEESNEVDVSNEVEESNDVEESNEVEESEDFKKLKEDLKRDNTIMGNIKNCYYSTLNCIFNFIFTNIHKVEEYLVSNNYMTITPNTL